MAVFSTNQVRQLYVVTKHATPNIASTDGVGTLAVKNDSKKNHLYFQYKGEGGITRSDLIDIKNILYAKSTKASDLAYKMKSITVKLDSTINGGQLIAGQDYILRLAFRQYIGMSDEDLYYKYGMVHAYAGMNPDMFYKTLAQSLAMNFSREITPLVKIEVHSKAAGTKGNFVNGYMEVTPATKDTGAKDTSNPYYDGTTAPIVDIDSIRITEVEQPWRLGVMEQVPVYFTVTPTTITFQGDEVTWGTVTEGTNGTIGNGKKIADMEYFYMGERGDIYRGIGWPNNIETKYLVDPAKAYHTLDIHYAYVGSNESVQKSEKDITLVCADAAELDKIIGEINKATGLSIANTNG